MISIEQATEAGAPAVVDREAASSLYLAGRLLELISKALIALGDDGLTAIAEGGKPVMPVEDRQSGYIGGTRLGYTQMNDGKTEADLKPDDPRLVAWALASDHYRHNVLTMQVLAPAVVTEIKKHAVKMGAPVDRHGEVVPGLTLKKGDPTPFKHLDKQLVAEVLAPERIRALAHALLTGLATLPGLTTDTERNPQ
ncbi:hypothetical protein [Nonomuraea basaltis]|uniref:hypothetical protein n=1 Tax=Nonomuraea basaltis TaxID=2495887 RepID=UPI00110C6C10|nr:hypothetical protein [Nonomuraea basaltis]TMR88304.1 hypothetical protein EJK15_67000 [Nonomuraea basaltis]